MLMALLKRKQLDEYVVHLDNGEEVITEYVMAPDSEHAAWVALELSEHRDCHLVNVQRKDDW
jgi:hypothetical protein